MLSTHNALLSRDRWIPVLLHSFALFSFVALGTHWGLGEPDADAIMFRPAPDTVHYVHSALRMLHGESALVPVGHELYLPRYSPVHPAFLAGWMWLNGGSWKALYSWSFWAIMLGAAALYRAIGFFNLPLIIRWWVVALTIFSPITFRCSWHGMQEPTIFLLFAVALCAWREERVWWRVILGCVCGMLYCIRETYFFFFLPILIECIFSPHRRLKKALLLGGGFLVTVVGIAGYNYAIAGYWQVNGYRQWAPHVDTLTVVRQWDSLFCLRQPFLAPLGSSATGSSDGALLELIGRDLFGFSQEITNLRWGSGLNLLALSVIGLWLAQGREKRYLGALLLFALVQIGLHSLYTFWDQRFLICVYATLLVLAGVGFNQLLQWCRSQPSCGIYRIMLYSYLLATVVGMFPGWHPFSPPEREVAAIRRNEKIREELEAVSRLEKGDLPGPLFTYGINPVAAQLFLNVPEKPIFLITRDSDPFNYPDGVLVGFMRVPPVGFLDGYISSCLKPEEVYLYDPSTKRINESITALFSGSDGMTLCIVADGCQKRYDLKPLLDYLSTWYTVVHYHSGITSVVIVRSRGCS